MAVTVREKIPGSGVWWIFINHNGTRKSKKVGPKSLAKEAAAKVQAHLTLGDLDVLEKKASSVPSFKEYAELWLSLPNDDWKESTRRTYRFNLESYVFPKLGNHPIDKIGRKDLIDLLDDMLNSGKAPRSIQVTKATISGVFSHAMDRELIDINPVRGIKIQGIKKKKGLEEEPLTEAEAVLLLDQVRLYRHGKYYPVILCALRTGMRIGELQALKWGDVDFNSRFLWVRRSWRKGQITETKNRARRRVDMSPTLSDTLKALRLTQKKLALEQGMPVPEWVFANSEGKVFQRHTFRKALVKCLEKAGLRHVRAHDLRHSYATIRLMRGHNIGDVSRQLGHSSIAITYDVYGHWVPGSFKSEVDDLDMPHPNAPYPHPEKMENVESLKIQQVRS